MFDAAERRYVETARVARLATADAEGRPHVVPICFVLDGDTLLSPIDEKPQTVAAMDLRRSRDIRANSRVAVVVDHYTEDWSRLGWVQLRGSATHRHPGDDGHQKAISDLRSKYDQYDAHDLEERPMIAIHIASVQSWGHLDADTTS